MSAVETVKNRLKVYLQVSEQGRALETGDIFIFNHFTRFETTLPPYIMYKRTGVVTRSVAHYSLFEVPGLGNHLRSAGAVPSNMPGLLPFLAKEILRGHKVVIFPEGGMVRDKKVVDENGTYSIYSSSAGKMRPHHKGAAALAVTLDMLKYHLKVLFSEGKTVEIAAWCNHLHLTPEALRAAIAKPTLLVPGTITYYPLRNGESRWIQTLEKLVGKLSNEALDDLVIESNLILNETDISINFGTPEHALGKLSWVEKLIANRALADIRSVEELFTLSEEQGFARAFLKDLLETETEKVRSAYARRLYEGTTININHLVATLFTQLSARGSTEIRHSEFHRIIYIAIKKLQKEPNLHLHCTLTRPGTYMELPQDAPRSLKGFLKSCQRAGVIKSTEQTYQITPQLAAAVDFNQIRLQNPVQVHYNEAFPITPVRQMMEESIAQAPVLTAQILARLQFDDELREYEGQRYRFSKKAPHTVVPNTEKISGRPSLLVPARPAKTGVLLIHGFASMSSEFNSLAAILYGRGYPVLTMRLPGHGTSHLDMEDRTHQEWLEAVRRNYSIISSFAEKVLIVGYSTGAVLGLAFAAEHPEKLAGVASLAAPYAVHDSNIALLPVIMKVRKLLCWIPALRNLLCTYPFGDPAESTSYHTVPVTALNELRLLIRNLTPKLAEVKTPVLVMQGTADTTVKAHSAEHILEHLGSQEKELLWLAGAPHRLLTEKPSQTTKEITKFARLIETR